MRETCSLLIAAQDVDVWSIAKSDNRRISPATKLACDKELTGVSSRRLVAKIRIVGWHDDLPLQISGDGGELRESGFQIFDDFLRDDIGIGKVRAVFEAFVLQPKDVEVELESPASLIAALRVALRWLFVAEGPKSVGRFTFVAVLWIVAGDEASPTNATAFPGSDDSLSRPRGGATSYLRQN